MVVLSSSATAEGKGGGGAFAWKCEAPPEGDDSSGAAELRMVVRPIKYAVGIRTVQRDLGVGIDPAAPTRVFTDAAAVVSGRGADHMAKFSRWLATRYAMIRWAERCSAVCFAHISSRDNCADIITKCLTGDAFRRHRATVLGLSVPGAPPVSTPMSGVLVASDAWEATGVATPNE
jgi:hypothetical protein